MEEEIARRMPEIEKKIAAKIRSEEAATPSADNTDNKLNREQVELINELKHREVKHVDHIHKLEKVRGPLLFYNCIPKKVRKLRGDAFSTRLHVDFRCGGS